MSSIDIDNRYLTQTDSHDGERDYEREKLDQCNGQQPVAALLHITSRGAKLKIAQNAGAVKHCSGIR